MSEGKRGTDPENTAEEKGIRQRIKELASSISRAEENEGRSKVVSLAEAIRSNVKPGMTVYLGTCANAGIYEIIRQFRGTKPGFTVIAPYAFAAGDLVHCGLVRKILACAVGEPYPAPGMSYVFNRAYSKGEVELEYWSYTGLTQRLMAGAMGVGFMPTRFMIGTSMAEENRESFQMMKDPFGSGKEIGIVKALNPDLAIVHGWVADRNGNTIMPPPVLAGNNTMATWASKSGAVVTVEKIVPTSFIREHAHLVKIPGYRVNAVAVTPMGAHPAGLLNWNVKELEAYGDDYSFIIDHRKITKDPGKLDAWLKEWVLDCPTHEDYLTKLGYDRIMFLKGLGRPDGLQYTQLSIVDKIPTSLEPNPTEMMVIAGARKIRDSVLKHDYQVILAGFGNSALAAWIAYSQVRKKGSDAELLVGSGLFGYVPPVGDPLIYGAPTVRTCKMLGDHLDAYCLFVCGENRSSLSVLAAAQVDRYGNLNSGKLSKNSVLFGPCGGGDAYQACEVVLLVSQARSRFLEKLPYVTSSGVNVKTLVSTRGVFEKLEGDDELTLTGFFDHPKFTSAEENIRDIKDNCAWELKVAPTVERIPPPGFDELMTLRLFDPERSFLGAGDRREDD